ncbi:MAG TPA: hypothetical protein VNT79_16205 [Phycisphaerae bacterium]|nr:hypothetical protein [Phycisphaerae bacterium]
MRAIYCGDNLDQLWKLPEACVDLVYINPPFAPSALFNLRMGFFATRGVAYFGL